MKISTLVEHCVWFPISICISVQSSQVELLFSKVQVVEKYLSMQQ